MIGRYLIADTRLLIALLLLPAVCFGDKLGDVVHSVDRRDNQLQASFLQFPALTLATNKQGKPAFQTIKLNKPVIIDGINFYGFRFNAPEQIGQEDLIWAFIEPSPRYFWYILPQSGSMMGFEEFFREPRASYQGLGGLFPAHGKKLVVQCLSGDALEAGTNYLIWFAFGNSQPAQMSLELTFADLHSKNIHNRGVLEKALFLRRARRDADPTAVDPKTK